MSSLIIEQGTCLLRSMVRPIWFLFSFLRLGTSHHCFHPSSVRYRKVAASALGSCYARENHRRWTLFCFDCLVLHTIHPTTMTVLGTAPHSLLKADGFLLHPPFSQGSWLRLTLKHPSLPLDGEEDKGGEGELAAPTACNATTLF